MITLLQNSHSRHNPVSTSAMRSAEGTPRHCTGPRPRIWLYPSPLPPFQDANNWRFGYLPDLIRQSAHYASDGECADFFLISHMGGEASSNLTFEMLHPRPTMAILEPHAQRRRISAPSPDAAWRPRRWRFHVFAPPRWTLFMRDAQWTRTSRAQPGMRRNAEGCIHSIQRRSKRPHALRQRSRHSRPSRSSAHMRTVLRDGREVEARTARSATEPLALESTDGRAQSSRPRRGAPCAQ